MKKTMPASIFFLALIFPLVLSSCCIYQNDKIVFATPVIVDSDNDGVADNYDNRNEFTKPPYYDKCPTTTPKGAAVDDWGCSNDSANVDSDKDGVPDYLDKCPGTPAGVKVDKDGCPLDSDGDGVPDYLDKCPGTPAGVKVDKDGCPAESMASASSAASAASTVSAAEKQIVEKGRTTINVTFDFDKAIIKKNYYGEIGKIADVMKKYTDLKIVIEGHTDNIGSSAYNEKLSQRRANAVKQYLVEKFGIEASRLSAKGYGAVKPIASNATEEGRQKNRRVEAVAEYSIKK
jgi:OmpA-OmpF porin, OOP family